MILFFCYVCPPLAVLLMGRPFSAMLNFVLWVFGWVPGVKHALVHYGDRKVNKVTKEVTRAIHRPEWTRPNNEQSEGRARRKGSPKPAVVYVDNPQVGMNGTKFRTKN
jgi:uncharacterized membrane protein YqaE (UPF0057 family)